ncbi:MAG: DNA polymerase III subunit gamma/tau [Opitutales bacterium]
MPTQIRDTRAFQVLDRALSNNRLAQAILLYGESLDTLEETALEVTRDLLTVAEPQNPLEHPDCFTLRAANKMRQINAENTRELTRKIQHSASQGERKVGIVYEAERMHATSANAFLKTLEEPPVDTNLFLLSTRPYELLDTIRSRCQFFHVPAIEPAIDDASWAEWLKDYEGWILGLVSLNPSERSKVTELTLTVYGLVFRFESILKHLSEAAWQARKADLPIDTLSDEQLTALEAGTMKSTRHKLLKEIEQSTRSIGCSLLEAAPQKVRAMKKSIESLEHQTRLLEVNLKETAALETFLLQSLRLWVG